MRTLASPDCRLRAAAAIALLFASVAAASAEPVRFPCVVQFFACNLSGCGNLDDKHLVDLNFNAVTTGFSVTSQGASGAGFARRDPDFDGKRYYSFTVDATIVRDSVSHRMFHSFVFSPDTRWMQEDVSDEPAYDPQQRMFQKQYRTWKCELPS